MKNHLLRLRSLLQIMGFRLWDVLIALLRGALVLTGAYFVTIFFGWCVDWCLFAPGEGLTGEGHFVVGLIVDLVLLICYYIGNTLRK